MEILDAGVAPDAITAIEVHVPPPYLAMIDHGVTAGDRASHLTSVWYRLALAAYDPDALFDVGHYAARSGRAHRGFHAKGLRQG